MAGLNGCTKGCISVEDKSCFSYQVAAGKIISEYNGVEVILKSNDTSKSSLPSVSSLHLISSGFVSSFASAIKPDLAPSKCFIKYSCPFAELEIKLERHKNKVFGWFSLASGSSIANLVSLDFTESIALFKISSLLNAQSSFASSPNNKLFLSNCG